MKKLKTFDSSYFVDKCHFEEDGTQNYLLFQPTERYFKWDAGVGSGNYIYYWKSKRWSNERINSIKTSRYEITPQLNYYGTKARVKFNGSCLKQDKVTLNYGKVVSIYVFSEITSNFNKSSYPTLENCLFGAVSLTKNADINRNGYSRYGIGFDRHGIFHILVVDLAKI